MAEEVEPHGNGGTTPPHEAQGGGNGRAQTLTAWVGALGLVATIAAAGITSCATRGAQTEALQEQRRLNDRQELRQCWTTRPDACKPLLSPSESSTRRAR